MLQQEPYANYVSTRLFDFFDPNSRWRRRLWDIGTILVLAELTEASDAVRERVISQAALRDLCHEIELIGGADPGMGEPAERRLLQQCLRSDFISGGHEYLTLSEIRRRADDRYLDRWAIAVADESNRPGPERAARAIGAHLLDSGFSPQYLHRWLTFQVFYKEGSATLPDLVAESSLLCKSSMRSYEVLVAFSAAPGASGGLPPEWGRASDVARWLDENGFSSSSIRQGGGLLLRIDARDPWAGVQQASETIDRLSGRVSVGTRSKLVVIDSAWVAGHAEPIPLREPRRVEVLALGREAKLYKLETEGGHIDSAFELLGPLDEGAPGPAAAAGWAAVESLLAAPGDQHRVFAGDRLASLVSCSFARGELTSLAWVHQQYGKDHLAESIEKAPTNRQRARLLAEAIVAGRPIILEAKGRRRYQTPSDRAAAERMRKLLNGPGPTLRDVRNHVRRTFRRLYRQRNLILHWGKTDAVALRPALRTAAPLVGAGIDRIAHAWFVDRVGPLELAARAEVDLAQLFTGSAKSPIDLLE